MPPLKNTSGHPRALTDEEVRRRLAWGRLRGPPLYVWPDVPRSAWRASAAAVTRAVSAGLRGEPAALEVPSGPGALGVAAYISGTGPLLGLWHARGCLQTDEAAAAILALHLDHGRQRARRRAHVIGHALSALPGDRPPTLLKGAHTGLTYFAEPGVRPSADVDILVPEKGFRAAERALRDAGYRAAGRQAPLRSTWLPPGEDGRIRALDYDHVENPLRLDLHGSLARSFYGVATVDPGPLGAEDTVPLDGGPDALGLAPPLLLVFLATHASEDLHNLQLIRLVELVLVARTLGPEGSEPWAAALARARGMEALRFTYPALCLAERLVPGSVDPAFLAAARNDAPARMRQALDHLDPAHAQGLEDLSLTERFMWTRGPAEALRRGLHMLVPSSTGGSLRALLRLYGARALRLFRGRVRLKGRGDPDAAQEDRTP